MSFMLNYNFLDKEVYTLRQIFNFNESDLCEMGMPPPLTPTQDLFLQGGSTKSRVLVAKD